MAGRKCCCCARQRGRAGGEQALPGPGARPFPCPSPPQERSEQGAPRHGEGPPRRLRAGRARVARCGTAFAEDARPAVSAGQGAMPSSGGPPRVAWPRPPHPSRPPPAGAAPGRYVAAGRRGGRRPGGARRVPLRRGRLWDG